MKIIINPANSNSQEEACKNICPDCNLELDVPCDLEKGEILSCPCCGLELEVKKKCDGGDFVEIQELTLEGEDWGE